MKLSNEEIKKIAIEKNLKLYGDTEDDKNDQLNYNLIEFANEIIKQSRYRYIESLINETQKEYECKLRN